MNSNRLLFVAVLVSLIPVQVQAQNLIQNPGFEDGLNYWDAYQYSSGWSASTANAHGGSNCVAFSFPSGQGYYDASIKSAGYTIPVEAGKTYIFSYWIREKDTRDTNTPDETILDPQVVLNGTPYGWERPIKSESWHLVERIIVFSESGNASIDFQLHGYSTSSNAEFAIDDVSLIPVQVLSTSDSEFKGIPMEFSMTSLYPNPFNPSLNVTVKLPQNADLQLVVYNVMGRQVAELSNGLVQAGYRTFIFDGSHLASGVYFVHASILGKMNQAKKVVLMK
ncbi:MAG: T9SS type A sorting domain-containing protein [bacterium]